MSQTVVDHINSNLSLNKIDEYKTEVLKYYDQGMVSIQTLLETFGGDYNEEKERIRLEEAWLIKK